MCVHTRTEEDVLVFACVRVRVCLCECMRACLHVPVCLRVCVAMRACVRACTGSEEDVAGRGVPADDADPFGVALQHHDGLRQRAAERLVWDLPHLDHTRRGEGGGLLTLILDPV